MGDVAGTRLQETRRTNMHLHDSIADLFGIHLVPILLIGAVGDSKSLNSANMTCIALAI